MAKKYTPKYHRKDAGQPRRFHGLEVVDAKKPLVFTVTPRDVKKGKPNDPDNCAGVLGCRRDHPDCIPHIYKTIAILEYPKRGIAMRHRISGAFDQQALRYDASEGKQFDTGKFELLPMPAHVVRSRGRQHSPPDRKRGDPNSPKRRVQHQITGRPRLQYDSINATA
jgi:hypothetical protein